MKHDIDDQPPKFYIDRQGRLWKDCRVQNFNFAVFEGFTEQSVPEEIWVACRSSDKYPDDLGLVTLLDYQVEQIKSMLNLGKLIIEYGENIT